jgi:SAM-dependent methyltransferase
MIKKTTREILGKFLEAHKTDKLTLDLGCKDSPYSHLFPNRVGFDVEAGKGVDVVGDAHSLPFPENKFDAILCTEVLEHLHTPEKAIAEMKRVLKPGGQLVLTTRFIFPLHDTPCDYYRFTKYGLRHLFKGWEISELHEETDTMGAVGILFERMIFQTASKAKFFKLVWLALSKTIPKLKFLIHKEYDGINRVKEETNLLSSGYYLVCKNVK